jgi:hypothetical protein
MLSCFSRNSYPLILNKNLRDYCRNSTNESIKKIIERHNSEKDKPKIKINNNDDDNNPVFNLLDFIFFLSVSSIAFFLYKRLK